MRIADQALNEKATIIVKKSTPLMSNVTSES